MRFGGGLAIAPVARRGRLGACAAAGAPRRRRSRADAPLLAALVASIALFGVGGADRLRDPRQQREDPGALPRLHRRRDHRADGHRLLAAAAPRLRRAAAAARDLAGVSLRRRPAAAHRRAGVVGRLRRAAQGRRRRSGRALARADRRHGHDGAGRPRRDRRRHAVRRGGDRRRRAGGRARRPRLSARRDDRDDDRASGAAARLRALLARMALAAAALTFVVIVASAFMRHAQAGLSCARLAGVLRAGRRAAAPTAPPAAGVQLARIAHRLAATGVLALVIALLLVARTRTPAWQARRRGSRSRRCSSSARWRGSASRRRARACPRSRSAICSAATRCWRCWPPPRLPPRPLAAPRCGRRRRAARGRRRSIALAAAFVQAALGGMIGAQFASLACPALVDCGAWSWPAFADGGASNPLRAPALRRRAPARTRPARPACTCCIGSNGAGGRARWCSRRQPRCGSARPRLAWALSALLVARGRVRRRSRLAAAGAGGRRRAQRLRGAAGGDAGVGRRTDPLIAGAAFPTRPRVVSPRAPCIARLPSPGERRTPAGGADPCAIAQTAPRAGVQIRSVLALPHGHAQPTESDHVHWRRRNPADHHSVAVLSLGHADGTGAGAFAFATGRSRTGDRLPRQRGSERHPISAPRSPARSPPAPRRWRRRSPLRSAPWRAAYRSRSRSAGTPAAPSGGRPSARARGRGATSAAGGHQRRMHGRAHLERDARLSIRSRLANAASPLRGTPVTAS